MAMNLISKLSFKRIRHLYSGIRLIGNKNTNQFKEESDSGPSIVNPFDTENVQSQENDYMSNLMTDKDK